MTDQKIKECIKAFAYGHSAEQVATAMCITVEEAQRLERDYTEEITLKRTELKEMSCI